MNWNSINLDSSFKRVEDEKEKELKFKLEDEEGNNLLEEEDGVILNQEEEDDDEDEPKQPKKKETKTKDVKDDEDEEDEVKVNEKKASETKETQKKTSRAQERIRELVKQKKEVEAKWQERFESLERQLQSSNKEALSTQKEFIDARIKDIKSNLAKLQEEGKFEDAANAMETLSELQTKKLVVDSTVTRQEQQEEKKQKSAPKEEDFDDTQLTAWLARNEDWFQKNQARTILVTKLSKKIDDEGILTPDMPEYYEELDERLADLLGKNAKKQTSNEDEEDEDNDVEDNEDLQSSSKDKAAKTKNKQQTTTGSSRNSAGKSKGKPVINLNTRERAYARKLGMTDVQFAKQKYRQEKNKDENGYQVIFDN